MVIICYCPLIPKNIKKLKDEITHPRLGLVNWICCCIFLGVTISELCFGDLILMAYSNWYLWMMIHLSDINWACGSCLWMTLPITLILHDVTSRRDIIPVIWKFDHHWYPLVNVNKKLWKDPPFLMGKSTISTGPFSIALCCKRLPGRVRFTMWIPLLLAPAESLVISPGCFLSRKITDKILCPGPSFHCFGHELLGSVAIFVAMIKTEDWSSPWFFPGVKQRCGQQPWFSVWKMIAKWWRFQFPHLFACSQKGSHHVPSEGGLLTRRFYSFF